MVCPVCIIPIVSGLSALGTGKMASSETSQKMKLILWVITIVFIILCLYYIYKKFYNVKCDECKI